jgi:hypothetical protein
LARSPAAVEGNYERGLYLPGSYYYSTTQRYVVLSLILIDKSQPSAKQRRSSVNISRAANKVSVSLKKKQTRPIVPPQDEEEKEQGEEEGEGEEATLVADSKLYDTEEDENAKSEPGSSGINAFITAFM